MTRSDNFFPMTCFSLSLPTSNRVADKKPAASIIKPTSGSENAVVAVEARAVSPKTPASLEDEVVTLRAKNAVLTDALKDIKKTAQQEAKKHYDLVWYARNRCKSLLEGGTMTGRQRTRVTSIHRWSYFCCFANPVFFFCYYSGRYPLHKERKRIEEEHADELKKLETNDADYHHGMHVGLLAATKLFEQHAEVIEHVEKCDAAESGGSGEAFDVLSARAKHKKAVEESRKSFPNVAVSSPPVSATD